MTRPDFGPGEYETDERDGDDERAEARALNREQQEDDREERDTGCRPSDEHLAESEAEAYTERDYEMDVTA